MTTEQRLARVADAMEGLAEVMPDVALVLALLPPGEAEEFVKGVESDMRRLGVAIEDVEAELKAALLAAHAELN